MDSSKYASFNVSEVVYKTYKDQAIRAYVLTPKKRTRSKSPVLVKFHGGFLHDAIIVAPEHRLLLESSGLDILDDVSDFWDWLRTHLETHLDSSNPGVKADLSRLAVCGESAGGYLALQSSLSQPAGFIRAVIMTYPAIDLESPHYTEAYEKSVFGAPQIPPSVLENHLKQMTPDRIVTSFLPPERIELCLSFVQQGRFPDFLGRNDSLYPMKPIEKVDGVPPMLILHGRDDSAVPVDGSVKFAAKATKRWGEGKVLLHIEPGEHGFDGAVPLETPWLQEVLRHVSEPWLGETKTLT